MPSLRITHPFPTLKQWALELDLDNMDPTAHAHVPFVPILIRAVDQWLKEHNGSLPSSYTDKESFKAKLRSLKLKPDEENIEEAEAQAWRAWSEPAVRRSISNITPNHNGFCLKVPSDILDLFNIKPLTSPNSTTPELNSSFHALLHTLSKFVSDPSGPGTLPLSASLPDMKTDTESYVRLQVLYREWAKVEKVCVFCTLDSIQRKDSHDHRHVSKTYLLLHIRTWPRRSVKMSWTRSSRMLTIYVCFVANNGVLGTKNRKPGRRKTIPATPTRATTG